MNLAWYSIFLTIILHQFTRIESANILFYQGLSTYSLRHFAEIYLEALIEKGGHNVTLFSPHLSKSSKKSKIINLSPKFLQEFNDLLFKENLVDLRREGRIHDLWEGADEVAATYCSMWLEDPITNRWAQESKFDLVITDGVFCECGLGLAYKNNCPNILLSSLPSLDPSQYDIFGIPPEHSWIPDIVYGYPMEMSLLQKTELAMRSLQSHFNHRWNSFRSIENSFRKHMNMPDMPTIDEMQRRTSLILLNSHFATDYAKSYPPNVVTMGGMHVFGSKVQPLPSNINKFLEKCSKFVYTSFGTGVDSSKRNDDIKDKFIKAFEALPEICFMMKWDDQSNSKLPSNVLLQKWMPQKDILAHPKLSCFITHGGLLGTQESLYNGIPVIVFPFFADQDYNANNILRKGYGIKLEIIDFTSEQVKQSIVEILNNPDYKKNAMLQSKLFRDRPDNPLDKAVWWTEFVIRNGKIKNMIPHSVNQTWYERRLLDVWGLIAISLLTLIVVAFYVLKTILSVIKSLFGAGKTKSNGPSKKNQ